MAGLFYILSIKMAVPAPAAPLVATIPIARSCLSSSSTNVHHYGAGGSHWMTERNAATINI